MAVAATTLLATFSTATANSYNTASVSLTANRLYLLFVGHRRSTNNPANTPTVTGASQTWAQVATHQYSGATRQRVTMFRCMPASNASGALTIDLGGQNQDSCGWILVEFTGAVTGSNGATAVVQSATNEATSSTSFTITLGAFASGSNAVFACARGGPATWTEEGGYTQMAEFDVPVTGGGVYASEFKDTSDTTPSWTFASANVWGGIAVEIAAAVAAVGRSFGVIVG